MKKYFLIAIVAVSFVLPLAPTAFAAPLTVLPYDQCSKFFGFLKCDQTTEVCATNPDTGNPGCFAKSLAPNFIDYVTIYPDAVTCRQKSNCPTACIEKTLEVPSAFVCSPSGASFAPNPGAACSGDNYARAGTCKTAAQCAPANTDTSGNCSSGLICCSVPAPAGGGGGNSGTGNGGGGGNSGTGVSSGGSPGTTVTLENPLGSGATLNTLLNGILDIAIQIGTVVIILMLVYVGFLFVVAQGNEAKITEARRALLWVVIGALILLGAKAIAVGIQATVNAISTGN